MQVVYFSKFRLIEVYAVLWECLNRTCQMYFNSFIFQYADIQGKVRNLLILPIKIVDCTCFLKRQRRETPHFPIPILFAFCNKLWCFLSMLGFTLYIIHAVTVPRALPKLMNKCISYSCTRNQFSWKADSELYQGMLGKESSKPKYMHSQEL